MTYPPVQAVIFDFDGLIIDSETPLFEIWSAIYEEHGHQLTVEQWQHALGTHGGFDPYEDLSTRLARTIDRETLAAHVRERHWTRCGSEPLLPGVLDRLEEAARLGLGAAVASSSPSAWVIPWMERHGLDRWVSVVCTRDHVARVKPAPDLFLLAAERLGVPPPSCLVFEDSPNGLRAAQAAGMRAVAVPNQLTRHLRLPVPCLVLDSLADRTLEEITALSW
ncbi:MAG TPA: HAD-IA family hydrolase [Vicinamibacterales bacterium]|nr:HAD-IA family hydrolase [Vicinamibacterales bacterium]